MKGSLAYLRAAVVGFALFTGGRALYQNRDRLKREWERVRSAEGLKGLAGDLSLEKLLSSIGSIRGLANQLGRFKQS